MRDFDYFQAIRYLVSYKGRLFHRDLIETLIAIGRVDEAAIDAAVQKIVNDREMVVCFGNGVKVQYTWIGPVNLD